MRKNIRRIFSIILAAILLLCASRPFSQRAKNAPAARRP